MSEVPSEDELEDCRAVDLLRVEGLWFRVWGLGFRVEGLGFRV